MSTNPATSLNPSRWNKLILGSKFYKKQFFHIKAMSKKVLYVVGLGHNGSTLLDLLLGASSGVFSSSQLNDLLAPYIPDSDSVKDAFWRKVLEHLEDGGKELGEQNQSIQLEKRAFEFIVNRPARTQYAKVNFKLLEALNSVIDDSLIVDSSKNISRALGLLEGDCERIYMLHLVRDIRSYVNSYNMRQAEQGKRNRYLFPAFHWYAKNIMASLFVKRRAKHYLLMKYEDFIQQPITEIQRLEAFCSTSFSETKNVIENRKPIFPSKRMTFRGNRILAKDEVVFDPKKSKRDGVFNSKLFWILYGWPSMFWGYRY